MDWIKVIIGCRLESIRLGKMSIAFELEDADPVRRYEIASNATVELVGAEATLSARWEIAEAILEQTLTAAEFDARASTLTLSFGAAGSVVFVASPVDADHIAIWKNLETGEWGLLQ